MINRINILSTLTVAILAVTLFCTASCGYIVEEDDETEIYKIVTTVRGNSLAGRISNESPLGKAMIGAKKGATIEVAAPDGIVKYEILAIKK